MNLSVRLAWYDAWIGVYVAREERAIYICPLPFVAIRLGRKPRHAFSHGRDLYAATSEAEAWRLVLERAADWREVFEAEWKQLPDDHMLVLPFGFKMTAGAWANGTGEPVWKGWKV